MTSLTNPLLRLALSTSVSLSLIAGAMAQKPKSVMSADSMTVSVSGSPIEFKGSGPMMEGESILVPFRAVLEKLGSTVAYDSVSKRIDASTTRYKVQLTPGSTSARVNDRDITMSVAPRLVAGTVYIPLRFVSESLGAKVQYDAATKAVQIEPGAQDTVESQTMNDTNATNSSNAPSNDGAVGNTMANDANSMTNVANGNAGVDTANATDANATGMVSNDSTAVPMENSPTNAPATENAPGNTPSTANAPSRPIATTTVAEAESTTEIPWLPIAGVLAALVLAAIIYFALKGRRSGQIIASNNDSNPKS